MSKKKKQTQDEPDTVVISFRAAKRSRELLEQEVELIKRTLKLHRRFTLSDYEAIINANRKETLDRILRGDIPIAEDF